MPLKKKANGKYDTGRPPLYETAEKLEEAINTYFNDCPDKMTIMIKQGRDTIPMEVPAPTVTGLAIHLGFVSRQSFYDYEGRADFSYIIKRARLFMEREYEQMLRTNSTGAIFALKNFGRTDRQEITGAEGEALFSTITIKKHGASSDANG